MKFAKWMMIAITILLACPGGAAAKMIGYMTAAEPITEARIARLPESERPAWIAYLMRSRTLLRADKAALAAERKGLADVPPPPAPGPSGGGGMPLDRAAAWYASPEARHVADTIVSFQTPAGGWGKNADRAGPARLRGQYYVPVEKLPVDVKDNTRHEEHWNYVGTIDNNATTSELRFLARVQAQLPGAEGDLYRACFLKGVRYLLNAQFPNGGWPQIYPLEGGYHDALTYNDNAIAKVVEVLSRTAERKGDYAFVPPSVAAEAKSAWDRAIAVILATQVKVDGKRTIWAQQHDALTLQPVGARNFEPAALASDESADLLMVLMRLPNPSPAIVVAVRDGISWLQAHAIRGYEWKRISPSEGHRLVADPATGPIWSRYYDVRTLQPIFGDRDRSIHDDISDLSSERRDGYSWFNSGPVKALAVYRKWEAGLPASFANGIVP
jgi:PelA/Pel-15E family pectate lyase